MGSKRISKRVREEAAIICSSRASDWTYWRDVGREFNDDGLSMYSSNEEALDLARSALSRSNWGDALHEQWAEAECLLRTGWSP